jgi:hypothetical protein
MGLAACGGSDDVTPSVVITSDNAPVVASEVLVDGGQFSTSNTLGGGLDLSAVGPTQVLNMAAHRLASSVRTAQARIRPLDTTQCAVSGTVTSTVTMTGTTSGSGTITFDNCVQVAGASIDGTITASVSASGTGTDADLKISATFDITATAGSIMSALSGDVTEEISSAASGDSIKVTADKLEVSISGGSISDDIKLSNYSVSETDDASGGTTITEDFSITSSRLKGSFAVKTNTPIQTEATGEYPSSGSITVTGASNTSLTITVLGNESFMPQAGQGQVELQIGSDAPIYMSWADVAAGAASTVTP